MPYLPNPVGGYRVVMGNDIRRPCGTYWRSDYCPDYKGNRTPVSDRPKEHAQILEILREYLEGSKIKIIEETGYECDDVIADLVRIKGEYPMRSLFMVTVDSDWLQLVSDRHNILFSNILSYTPRLRSEAEALEWALRSEMVGISQVSEIAYYKALLGDRSDNLGPGSPIGVVSLLDPIQRVSPHTTKLLRSELEDTCSNTCTNHVTKANSWLTAHNLPIIKR
jgi:5'-3' exonuclease